jgi:hypothetical protein
LAEDLDKLREMEMFGEDDGRDGVWTVMANVMDPESMHRAFDGCAGVFHTSGFVDPGGMSGYTVSSVNFFLLLVQHRIKPPKSLSGIHVGKKREVACVKLYCKFAPAVTCASIAQVKVVRNHFSLLKSGNKGDRGLTVALDRLGSSCE